jgi:acyl-CoA thioester hydrolase
MSLDAPSMGRFDGRTHLLPVRIYYEDTDFSGVVYHANYLRYFERGRSDFLRAGGVPHTLLLDRPDPLALAVRGMQLAFIRPAKIDDALVVATRFRSLKGARMHLSQVLLRDGEPLASAEVEAACIGLDGRPRRVPADVAEKIAPFIDP